MANIHEPEWQLERDEPFPMRIARIGQQAGAEKLGAGLFEVGPGGNISALHMHTVNEEMIIVLEGRPTLRTPDGSRQLEAGEVVACLAGMAGAHTVENHTDETIRVLIMSTLITPEIDYHIESETVFAHSEPGKMGLAFKRGDAITFPPRK
jgi:uncharacterized cupin superfamily protein